MVLILDGNSELVAHMCSIDYKFAIAVNLNKGFKQIKLPALLLTYTIIFELPSDIDTTGLAVNLGVTTFLQRTVLQILIRQAVDRYFL